MENRSPKLPVPKGKYQSSCIWGLVDMLNFGNGRTNLKLLSKGRTMHKHGFDAEYSRKVDMLANFYEKCQGLEDGAGLGNHDVDACETKVKDIMQEEFPTERKIKKLLKAMKQQHKRSDFGSFHQSANNHKKARKTSKKSFQESIVHRKEKMHMGHLQCSSSDELSLDNSNFAATLEEICSQMYQDGRCNGDMQRSITPSRSNQLDDIDMQLFQMSVEPFINQIYINRRYLSKDTAGTKLKQFSDASEIMHLDRDFLKLLQDPNSTLVKHIQKLQFPPREKERIKFYLESSECQVSGSSSCESECTMKIQKKNANSLLWKKLKHRYGSSSKGNTNSSANEIVVLKPASKSKKNPENVSCHCSASLQSQLSLKRKARIIKSTHFSLKEIKRKIKEAVVESRKEQNLISLDSSPSKLSRNKHSLKYIDNGVSHSISARESTVFIDAKRWERQQKTIGFISPNGPEIDSNNEFECQKLNSLTTSCFKQEQLDISIEAKRHLSERLKNMNVSEVLPRKQLPRTLQMILSSPKHDLVVTHSPKRDTSACVSAQMRFSLYNHIQKEKEVSCTSPRKENEVVPPSADFGSDDQLEIPECRSGIPESIDVDTENYENVCATGDDFKPSGYADILEENESMLPGNLNNLEVPCEVNRVDSTYCEPNIETIKLSEDKGNGKCSSSVSFSILVSCVILLICSHLSEDNGNGKCSSSANSSEDQHRRYLLRPSSSPLDISALEILETRKYREGYPSPVSVLETFSLEDANCPTSITPKPDESSLQPRCIDIDDQSQIETPEDSKINVTVCMDEDEYMSAFVRAVMQASYINFEELSSTSPLPLVLNTYAVDSVGLFQVKSHCDLNIVLDCIHEVLLEVYHCYFGCSPWLSFLKPNIRPAPLEANVVDEVVKEVSCYISPELGQPTLDQLVRRDLAKFCSWLELGPDTEDIAIQIAEDVLQESLLDTFLELQI